MRPASPEAVDLALVGVDADHAEARTVHGHEERQADVAETDDGCGGRSIADANGERIERMQVEI